MAKVRCSVCANEKASFCVIKKIKVKINKSRLCEAFVYDEAKLKARQEVPTTKFGYRDQQETKKRMKEELKALREMLKQQPKEGTARNLGLIPTEKNESSIIMPGDSRFSMPSGDLKHPLTGDLSRFTTTINKDGE